MRALPLLLVLVAVGCEGNTGVADAGAWGLCAVFAVIALSALQRSHRSRR